MMAENTTCTAWKAAKYGGAPFVCHLTDGHPGEHEDALMNPVTGKPAFITAWSED